MKAWNTPQELLRDGRLVRKPQDMANMLSNYYQDKIDKLSAKIPQSMRKPHRFLDRAIESWEEKDNRPVFKIGLISLSETQKLISDMGNLDVLGHDKIDAQGIKAAASQLVKTHPAYNQLEKLAGQFSSTCGELVTFGHLDSCMESCIVRDHSC